MSYGAYGNDIINKDTKLPKLYKTPTKARSVIAAPRSFGKLLSKSITAVFEIFFHQIESYSNRSQYFFEINTFQTIFNIRPVIKIIHKIKTNSISFFDFSTLYTNILQNKLFKVLCELINFCLKSKKDYITIYKYATKWTTQDNESLVTQTKGTLKQSVKFL